MNAIYKTKDVLSVAILSTTLCLVGCFNQDDKAGIEQATEKNEIATNTNAASESFADRGGVKPHGQADPHVNLTPEKYAMVALGHLDEGRTKEAFESINNALKLHSESADLYAIRSQIYATQGNESLALADLERAVSLDSQNPSHYVNRAAVYSKFDRDDQALEDLNKAVSLNSDMLAARFSRGSLRFIKEDHQGALEDFEHCIAVDPHAAAPYFNRAAVHDAMGSRDLAIDDMQRFLQLAKDENWKKTAEKLLASWQDSNSAQTEVSDEAKG